MGNCLWRSLGDDDSDSDTPVEHYPQHSYGGHEDGDYSSHPDPITITVVGVEAFVRDLMEFETTNEVPKALSNYGCACGATQRLWFTKLLIAWKQANPTPTSAKAVAVFLIETLQRCSNFQDLLRFYQLSWPTVSAVQLVPMRVPVGELETRKLETHAPAKKLKKKKQKAHVPLGEPETRKLEAHAPAKKLKKKKQKAHVPLGELKKKKPQVHVPARKLKKRAIKSHAPISKLDPAKPEASGAWLMTPKAPTKVQYEIHTLPVTWKEDEGDGDGFTVFVNVHTDARETKLLPKAIKDAALLIHEAQAQMNYKMASALQKKIEAAKYKLFEGMNNGAWFLARKYKIRLRGVDAPEIEQQYGEEARDLLRSLVNEQQLVIRVYNTDNYGRKVGDIYCNGIFIQEVLLKKGLVWHYNHFDERKNFAEWEMAAKKACLGLWANPNPKAPWDYRQMCGNRGSFKGRGA